MKSKLFYLLNIFLVFTCLGMAESKMNVPVQTIDFGYAPQKSQVTSRFWIYSTGTDTLKISDVKPGCGCTKAPLEKKILPPGDSTFVDITFNTGSYRGRITKTVNITAENGVPAQIVHILSNIQTDDDSTKTLVISPSALDVAGAPKNREVNFKIENKTSGEIKPQLDSFQEGMIEIKLPKSIKPGKTAEGKIKALEDIPSGFAKSFTFTIDDATQSRFTVPIKGEPAVKTVQQSKAVAKPN